MRGYRERVLEEHALEYAPDIVIVPYCPVAFLADGYDIQFIFGRCGGR